jgi:hypothetical protein
MRPMEPLLDKEVDAGNAYFTLRWSPILKADRHEIVRGVPAVAGLFELYYMDKSGGLNLFLLGNAWYGGLRSWIRGATDPSVEIDPGRRKILNAYPCYYRYSMSNSHRDIQDVLFFLGETYFAAKNPHQPSGRYENVFVNEVTPQKLLWR